MSKKYHRDEKVIERLEKENRELKAENRALTRRNKMLSRGYRKRLDRSESDDLKVPSAPITQVCPECAKGTIVTINVINRCWTQCTLCDFRSKVVINETV